MARRLAEGRFLAAPALVIGVVLGLFGWAAAFTEVGLIAIIAGSVAIVIAAILRPAWRFLLVCAGALFCIWGGPILIIAALRGD